MAFMVRNALMQFVYVPPFPYVYTRTVCLDIVHYAHNSDPIEMYVPNCLGCKQDVCYPRQLLLCDCLLLLVKWDSVAVHSVKTSNMKVLSKVC